MSLFLYLCVMAVWVGLIEVVLYERRRQQYHRIEAMREQAAALLREARLARLRATVSLGSRTGRVEQERRAS